MFDLDFQGHAIKIEFFHYTVKFLDPENIPMRNIFKKFGREGTNPGGVVSTPLGRFRLAKYLGHLRVNVLVYISIGTLTQYISINTLTHKCLETPQQLQKTGTNGLH